jgi:catechol 2,3-dioxygenase-like lactoylglutathione lyase family enzyme
MAALATLAGCKRGGSLSMDATVAGGRAKTSTPPAAPLHALFGREIGLDHFGFAVKDLGAARKTYTSLLGFNRPLSGKLPNGLENVVYYFEDGTYIEALTPYDAKKAPWYDAFLKKFEGPVFYVLSIFSERDARAFLKPRGLELSTPQSGTILMKGEKKAPDEIWHTIFLKNSPIPGRPFFFIKYKRKDRDAFFEKLKDKQIRRTFFRHANTALGLRAAWHAVPDLEAAVKAYASIGLRAGRSFEEPRLGARGRVVEAGQGVILLLAPANKESRVASFLEERKQPMLLGMSIEVASIVAAKRYLSSALKQEVTSSASPMGISILLEPERAHGVWLELFQRPGRVR